MGASRSLGLADDELVAFPPAERQHALGDVDLEKAVADPDRGAIYAKPFGRTGDNAHVKRRLGGKPRLGRHHVEDRRRRRVAKIVVAGGGHVLNVRVRGEGLG